MPMAGGNRRVSEDVPKELLVKKQGVLVINDGANYQRPAGKIL